MIEEQPKTTREMRCENVKLFFLQTLSGYFEDIVIEEQMGTGCKDGILLLSRP